jgi:Ca-activated chloride channel family protein
MNPNKFNHIKEIIYKKWWALLIILIILIGGYTLISQKFGKVDDWKYSYYSIGSIEGVYLIPIIIGGLLVLVWIIKALIFIFKGKPIMIDGIKKMNPERIIGISLLLGPIIIIALSCLMFFLIIHFDFESLTPLLFILAALIGFFIFLGIYSRRNKIKLGFVPLIIILLLLLGGGASIILVSLGGARSRSSVPVSMPVFTSPGGNVPSVSTSEIGFSVGGAKDIDNFRKSIENGYLPLVTDITYEGLFYDYYFDTGEEEQCQKLFCPSYSYAISADPFSKNNEYYLSVGLNSGIKESDFQRKKLNLVIVLDISGSMSSQFNKYYYDVFGGKVPIVEGEEDKENEKSKMQVANESIVALIDHLNNNDRFGMVLFDSNAYLAKPLRDVGDTDMGAIKSHVLDLKPRNSTNMEAGMKLGTELFENFLDSDPSQYENRIIFLTDAMPNTGMTNEEGLFGIAKKNSDNRIYTTFIGIGVDFNTELIEYITKMRGANYYSVHSAKQFKDRMDDEFEYMVTPLVFNLLLKLETEGYEIEKVYGSPEANEATGEIMKVNTLFPSRKEEAGTKGGIVILKLKKTSLDNSLNLKVSYEDREGKIDSSEKNIVFPEKEPDFFQNTGIRKGILLSRYTNLVKNWINDERGNLPPSVDHDKGIVIPDSDPVIDENRLSRWERQSAPLNVSTHYKNLFKEFIDYFEKEMNALGDETLNKENPILKELST